MKNLKTLLFVLLVLLNSSESLSQISIGWAARYNNQNFGYDVGLALTVDNNGNVYVTGNRLRKSDKKRFGCNQVFPG
ncbi:MAG: hypothetical protein IPG99_17085 [Ignavibacteria bacterium]|nr:hypothetical protein [Ignavibacteria bacterium]